MSNTIDVGGISAKITADISGFQQGVEKAKAKAKELGEAGKQASASFSTLNTRLSELGASASQIEKINDRLKKANPQILERQLAAVRDELTKLGASSAEIDKITSELEKNARSANVVGKEVRQLGLAYTALAVAMAVVIKKAVETSATFEQSMARVKAITSATGEEFDKLRNQAAQLGATTVFTSSQAADAMGYLGMAGFKTKQIMESLPSVLALAAAGQMDLARTADIASNILTGFQLEASEAARVSDVLAKTMTSSNTNIEQLGYAFKYVAPIAASVGVSIEEAAAAIGKLSDAGIQGEMAGTQLRAILLRLVKPVGESAEIMEKLGVDIKDAAGNILPFNEIIGQLEKGFAKLTQAQQAEAASIIAGTEAASGFLTLIKTGSATLDSFTKDLQNAGGTAQDIADTQMDTLNGAIKEMESALEAVGITIGDKFAPAIRGAAEAITGVLLGFNNLNPALQTAIIAFTTVVPLIAGAVTAIYALRAALVALEISVPILGAVSVAIGLVVAGIAALVSSNNEAAASAKRFEQAQKSLHDQLSKSPLSRTAEEVRQLQESEKELTELLRERKQIERDLAEAREKPRDIFDRDARKNLADLNEKLAETDKRLRDMGYEGVEAAEKGVRDLRQAVEESIPGLLELKSTELAELATKNDKIVTMEKLSERYKELSAQQTLDESQKQELVDVTNALKREYPALIAHMDEENRVRIENINKIDERIAADKSLLESAVNTSIGSIDAWKKQEEAQKLSIERQIENAKKYVDAMNQVGNFLSDKFGINVGETRFGKLVGNLVDKGRAELEEQRNKSQSVINELDRVKASLESGSYDDFKLPTGTGDGLDLSKSKKEKTSK
ncbi:phage tail tape measure protein, partial [Paenibacillus dendritiformis]|uniref:phage tail tape measure protein n=1 Tax=Paenibacillus dendritiformis TaxID=130049 RepID=UPI00387E0668